MKPHHDILNAVALAHLARRRKTVRHGFGVTVELEAKIQDKEIERGNRNANN